MSGGAQRWDELTGYCRRLGHPLRFGYCRTTSGDAPCPKILDCWHERFDVVGYLRHHGPPGFLEVANAPPPPKLASLVELVEKARRQSA